MTEITVEMIRKVSPGGLHHAGADLGRGARDLRVNHEHYVQTVEYPVSGGHMWSGAGQPYAAGVTNATAAAIDGVHLRLGPAATVLNGLADYLTTARRKVAELDRSAANLHASLHGKGEITVHPIHGESEVHKRYRHTAATALRAEALAVVVVTAGMDKTASSLLARLAQGDVTTPPPAHLVDEDFWTQSFDRPGFWENLDGAIKDLALPPADKGLLSFGAWGLSKGLDFGPDLADWRARLRFAHLVPTGKDGLLEATKGAPWLTRARWVLDKKNWHADPGREDDWAAAKRSLGRWGKVAGRGSIVLSFGTSAWDQWDRDAHRYDLSTADKIERAVYRGTVVTGASMFGAAFGDVAGPVGGIAGGVVGGAGGNWYVDQTIGKHGPDPVRMRLDGTPTPGGAWIPPVPTASTGH